MAGCLMHILNIGVGGNIFILYKIQFGKNILNVECLKSPPNVNVIGTIKALKRWILLGAY